MKIQDEFESFHKERPEIYKYLVQLARQVKAAGIQRYGMKALWERLRWHFSVELVGDKQFKLKYKMNNSFTSRYARKIMAENNDLRGFFRTKPLRAA